MKIIELTQEEFIVFSYCIESGILLQYAGTGLLGKDIKIIIKNDRTYQYSSNLVQKGLLISKSIDKKEKIFFINNNVFIKNKTKYDFSSDAQLMKLILEEYNVNIDIMEEQGIYSVCTEKLMVSKKGCLSIRYNEIERVFIINISNYNEIEEFFSEKLNIPLGYRTNTDSYQIKTTRNQLDKLKHTYLEKNTEEFSRLASMLSLKEDLCIEYINATGEHSKKRIYLIHSDRSLISILIYHHLSDYYILKNDSNESVTIAKQALSDIIKIFLEKL